VGAASGAERPLDHQESESATCRLSPVQNPLKNSLSLLISGQIDARSLVPFYCRGVFASVIGRSERGGEQQRRPDSDVWEQAARDEISGADRVGD
jgi:hypothetical protein